jgi:hypothetical protein
VLRPVHPFATGILAKLSGIHQLDPYRESVHALEFAPFAYARVPGPAIESHHLNAAGS